MRKYAVKDIIKNEDDLIADHQTITHDCIRSLIQSVLARWVVDKEIRQNRIGRYKIIGEEVDK